jgi:NAD-dependent SIR2 family protein deacetylase
MEGDRHLFSCTACGKKFTFWVPKGNEHPKPKCSFCSTEFFPFGEPPAAPVPPPGPPASKTEAPPAPN